MTHHDDELITGEAVALDVRPTSFILRAAGAAIDMIATFALLTLLLIGLLFSSFSTLIDPALGRAIIVSLIVLSLVVIPAIIETVTHGKSLGKLVIGARIVRDDGGAISFRHAFIRALTGLLELFSTLGGIAILSSLLNRKAKRLGDFLAGTYSQHERVPAITSSARACPSELTAWAQNADVAKLPERLARRIAQFLKQSSGLTPQTRERLAHELAREAQVFVSPIPSVHPEVLLAGIAAIRRDREYHALLQEQQRLARLAPVLNGLPHGFPDR